MALKQAHGQTTWISWPSAISRRRPDELEHWRQSLAGEIFTHKFIQYEFYRQWLRLKAYANHRGVQIIGDLPIYVAHDSAEVWAHPEHFCLEEATGEPALMAGVPPDYFSAQGQLWGNPIYEWGRLQNDRFGWWIQRFQTLLECVDIIRIDHFRGFQAYWIVKQGETTAMNGEWVEAPGEAFFETLRDALGQLPIIAEDLGVITPEVEALRDKFEFPGMKILQFAFGSGPKNPYLPFNHARNCVVYTATHDNNTTLGWFEQLSAVEKKQVTEYLGCHGAWGIHWDLIRLAFGSVANLAIIPLQDVLGLGGGARMNFPSKKAGNWRWRYAPDSLTDEIRHRLKSVTVRYGRTRVVT